MEKPWIGNEASKSLIKELYSLQSDLCIVKISDWILPVAEVSPFVHHQISAALGAQDRRRSALGSKRCSGRAARRARGVGARAAAERRIQDCLHGSVSCAASTSPIPSHEAVRGSEESCSAKYQLSASSLTWIYLPIRRTVFFASYVWCQGCISSHI